MSNLHHFINHCHHNKVNENGYDDKTNKPSEFCCVFHISEITRGGLTPVGPSEYVKGVIL